MGMTVCLGTKHHGSFHVNALAFKSCHILTYRCQN